jgi:hypothetical protein
MSLTYQTHVIHHQVGFDPAIHSCYTNHRRHGQLHRLTGPAILRQGQVPYWYYYGKLDSRGNHYDTNLPV